MAQDQLSSKLSGSITRRDADMKVLKNIETIKDYGDSSFFPVFGGKL